MKIEELNKETLEYLYVKKRMTQDEISKLYNCDRHCISRRLKWWNIPIRSKYERVESTKNKLSIARAKQVMPKWSDDRRNKTINSINTSEKRKKANDNLKKINNPDGVRFRVTKSYLTKKANGTLNTSKLEEDFYNNLLLENKSKTIYRNYKCDRYPFYCDFYIVEDDLFIECNFHWTHGGMPYDPNNEECIDRLNEWKLRAETSQYYKNAIETWTVRDVNKLKVATENNLNYKVIY